MVSNGKGFNSRARLSIYEPPSSYIVLTTSYLPRFSPCHRIPGHSRCESIDNTVDILQSTAVSWLYVLITCVHMRIPFLLLASMIVLLSISYDDCDVCMYLCQYPLSV